MIDLHSHILPCIDDGSKSVEMSLDMARAWVDDGVTAVACTPHILPGVYANAGPQIRAAISDLQTEIDAAGLPLRLLTGADNHIVPDFVSGIASGHLLTLADTRYVLVEPPHHVAPPRLKEFFFQISVAGYVPILTHPERLAWIEQSYAQICALADAGTWMQITSGSLRGSFGQRAKYWAERMIAEGRVSILASDAHNMKGRPPDLSKGRDRAAELVGTEEAANLVLGRPSGIVNNISPSDLPPPLAAANAGGGFSNAQTVGERPARSRQKRRQASSSGGLLGRLFGGLRGNSK